MSPDHIGLMGIALLLILLIAGMHIGLVMIFVGFVGYLLLTSKGGAMGVLATAPRGSAAYYTLSIIPLFIFMGQLASYSKVSEEMHRAAQALLGHVRGGFPWSLSSSALGLLPSAVQVWQPWSP